MSREKRPDGRVSPNENKTKTKLWRLVATFFPHNELVNAARCWAETTKKRTTNTGALLNSTTRPTSHQKIITGETPR